MPRSSRRSRAPGSPSLSPQLAQLAAEAPSGADWVHEIKYDGYRILAERTSRDVRLWTRNGKDWSQRYEAVAAALAHEAIPAGTVLDGEVVAVDADGRTRFQALQNADGDGGRLAYFVFDVLRVGAEDVRALPLLERKAFLRELVDGLGRAPVLYSDHHAGDGARFLDAACSHGLEGIISKRASAPYRPGRGSDWLKVKCLRVQEFVIGGFTPPRGSRSGFGALLLGTWDDGRLTYRGKVGTGFNAAALAAIHGRLERLAVATSPFDPVPRGADVRGAQWVRPALAAQVQFTELTADGRLRHPSFQGLREDKPSEDVVLEEPGMSGKTTSRNRGGGTGATRVAGVRLTSPAKDLYAGEGITKRDLAEYYVLVADLMAPHIRGRPLTLVRCPAGYDGDCFFQKHMDDHVPEGVRRVRVKERDGPEWYGVLDGVEGLVGLVQMGALELHTWNSREDRLERPDRFIIDLDPDEGMNWDRVIEAALHVRMVLAEVGLESFLKTSGGKGVHVVVPLVRRTGWDEVRDFSRAVCAILADALPDRYTLDVSKQKRRGRILLDFLRNTRGATAVEVYSTRARAGAPVSAPISWAELEAGVRSDSFNVRNMADRLASLDEDPWKDFGAVKQSLTAPMRRKLGLG